MAPKLMLGKVTRCASQLYHFGAPAGPRVPHLHLLRHKDIPAGREVSAQVWKLLPNLLEKYLMGIALKTRVCETVEPMCSPHTTEP